MTARFVAQNKIEVNGKRKKNGDNRYQVSRDYIGR